VSKVWKLTAVCDQHPAKLEPFRSGPVAVYTDYREMFTSGLADAVIVTLPNNLHDQAVTEALTRGLHVCCEKPLATRTADADRLADLALDRGLVLLTASHRRYNQHLRALAGRLPERSSITRVEARYLELIEEHTGNDRWYLETERSGGGCVIDNGPNVIDMVRVLLGELTVTGCQLDNVVNGNEFRAHLALRSVDGIPVDIELDWSYPGQVKDVAVHLADGQVLRADMLAGFTGLKGSLAHEYEGILDHLASLVDAEPIRDDGPHIVGLVEEAYRRAAAPETAGSAR
jgi:predicted dehydrogenase